MSALLIPCLSSTMGPLLMIIDPFPVQRAGLAMLVSGAFTQAAAGTEVARAVQRPDVAAVNPCVRVALLAVLIMLADALQDE